MNNPWLEFKRGRQLEAFIGVWGIRTSDFETSDDLMAAACRMYDITPSRSMTVDTLSEKIEALGKKERRFLAMKNLGTFHNREASRQAKNPITEEALVEAIGKETPQLVDGASQDCIGELDIDPSHLLRKVLTAIISGGHGHLLYEFPEVLEFMGSRIPKRSELAGHHGIDERMFAAKAKWPNLMPGYEV